MSLVFTGLLPPLCVASALLFCNAAALADGDTSPARPNVTISAVVGSGNSVIVSEGNGLIVLRNGGMLDLDRLVYQGKANSFWSQRRWSSTLGCVLYWCPKTALWYRYHAGENCYRPALEELLADADRTAEHAIKGASGALQAVDQMLSNLFGR